MRSLCWKFRNGAGVPECCKGISCCRNRRWLSQSSLSPITTNHSLHHYRDQILSFSVPIGFFSQGCRKLQQSNCRNIRGRGQPASCAGGAPWWERFCVSALLWTLKRSHQQSLMSASENSKVCSERTTRTNLAGDGRHNENMEWPLSPTPSELSINMTLSASSAFSFASSNVKNGEFSSFLCVVTVYSTENNS